MQQQHWFSQYPNQSCSTAKHKAEAVAVAQGSQQMEGSSACWQSRESVCRNSVKKGTGVPMQGLKSDFDARASIEASSKTEGINCREGWRTLLKCISKTTSSLNLSVIKVKILYLDKLQSLNFYTKYMTEDPKRHF